MALVFPDQPVAVFSPGIPRKPTMAMTAVWAR